MKRTPMKRTAWLRTTPTVEKKKRNRAQTLTERAQRAIKNAVGGAQRAATDPSRKSDSNQPPTLIHQAPVATKKVANASITARPKNAPIRSKAYLRLVAQLPCKHCGIWGHSQAAHANTGKGMGTKACDLQTFPLCADRPGQRGCHSLFDQGALFGKEARRLIEQAWVADTQRQIHAMGIWPKKYPYQVAAQAA